MAKSFLRHVISAGFACVGIGLTLHGGDARAVVVDVGGSIYDVTTISGTYNSLLPTLSTQPWFGNVGLATSFSNAVWDRLGLPNYDMAGPGFATSANSGYSIGSFVADGGSGIKSYGGFPMESQTVNYIYAQAQPVPGPLPLFGAMAGFGMSRRLRARIKTASPKRVVL